MIMKLTIEELKNVRFFDNYSDEQLENIYRYQLYKGIQSKRYIV